MEVLNCHRIFALFFSLGSLQIQDLSTMDTHSLPAASTSLLPATDHSIPTWEVVLRTPRRVVVWNATTSSLAVSDSRDWISEESLTTSVQEDDEGLEVISQTAAESSPTSSGGNSPQFCPLCLQPTTRRSSNINGKQSRAGRSRSASRRKNPTSRNTSSYFALLSEANSRANTPRTTRTGGTTTEGDGVPLDESTYNSGYFSSFFVDIKQLGKGASGTVRLVRHMLNGEELGYVSLSTGEDEANADTTDDCSLYAVKTSACLMFFADACIGS